MVRYFLNWDFLFEFCYWNHYLNSMTINQQIDDSFVVSNFLTATCDFWTIHFWWSYFSLNRFLLCSLRTKLKCGLYYYVLFKWKFDFILYWNLSGTAVYWVPEIPILALGKDSNWNTSKKHWLNYETGEQHSNML